MEASEMFPHVSGAFRETSVPWTPTAQTEESLGRRPRPLLVIMEFATGISIWPRKQRWVDYPAFKHRTQVGSDNGRLQPRSAADSHESSLIGPTTTSLGKAHLMTCRAGPSFVCPIRSVSTALGPLDTEIMIAWFLSCSGRGWFLLRHRSRPRATSRADRVGCEGDVPGKFA